MPIRVIKEKLAAVRAWRTAWEEVGEPPAIKIKTTADGEVSQVLQDRVEILGYALGGERFTDDGQRVEIACDYPAFTHIPAMTVTIAFDRNNPTPLEQRQRPS